MNCGFINIIVTLFAELFSGTIILFSGTGKQSEGIEYEAQEGGASEAKKREPFTSCSSTTSLPPGGHLMTSITDFD